MTSIEKLETIKTFIQLVAPHRTKMIQNLYEVIDELSEKGFKCPAYIMAGPGHQSKHPCEYDWPHDINGEHGAGKNYRYEWVGDKASTGAYY